MYINRKMNIALVDDDEQMREMLSDFLTEKYPESHIETYSNGEDAIKKITEEPDLLILDYHLDSNDPAAMNGLQILKKIKESYHNLPVIFLSGQEKAEIAANTIKYGAWDYVVKNENAFHRIEILITNITGNVELKKNLGTQKFFNRLLAILLIALIIGFILMKLN
jgi:two-component system OmpR family response regulator